MMLKIDLPDPGPSWRRPPAEWGVPARRRPTAGSGVSERVDWRALEYYCESVAPPLRRFLIGWDARCDEWADAGDEVVVKARDGLTLIVERA
jgi:hypothetical protein